MKVPTGSASRGGDVAVYVFDIKQSSLTTPLYSVLVSISGFMALSTVFHSITLRFLTLFFRPHFCLIGPFNYVSLYESLPQPCPPKRGRGCRMSPPLSGISGPSFDSTLLSLVLFFCLVLLPFLSCLFLPAGPFV